MHYTHWASGVGIYTIHAVITSYYRTVEITKIIFYISTYTRLDKKGHSYRDTIIFQ